MKIIVDSTLITGVMLGNTWHVVKEESFKIGQLEYDTESIVVDWFSFTVETSGETLFGPLEAIQAVKYGDPVTVEKARQEKLAHQRLAARSAAHSVRMM